MTTICDTGPIVAYLNRNDPYHAWAVTLMKQVRSPMLTSEPVLTEAAYFLRADRVDVDSLFQLLERDALRLDFQVAAQLAAAPYPHGPVRPHGSGRRVDCCHERAAPTLASAHC